MKQIYIVVGKVTSDNIDRVISIEGIFKSEKNAEKRFDELEEIYRYSKDGLWFDMYDIPTDLID
ncbi:MAG: hypothetical protein MJ180_00090 [Candidatus Gastranaerophilales bacterium]|nr:hypothetical protein [Candidatus Gastranaerophilales bacterium]